MYTWCLAIVLAGCDGTPPAEPEPQPVAAPEAPAPPEPLPPPTETRYAASHLLIAYAGAVRAPKTTTRSKEEAAVLAEKLHQQISNGAKLSELAREHSDGPSARRKGSVGAYRTGTMVPAFEAAVASVAPGELTPVTHTPFGYHVIQRDAIVQARASHILVSWEGAWRSGATRTREDASKRIREAISKLDAGEEFAAVASRYTDDATADQGGDLGVIAPGQMLPAFEEAVFALKPDERSDVVETPYGYHVVLRTE